MWEQIKRDGILTYTSQNGGKFTSSIPEGTAALVANRIIGMMDWIYSEFSEDTSKNQNIFNPSANYEEQQKFIIRNTSRTLSYINHVCSLELIIKKLYDETISRIKVIDSSIAKNSSELLEREDEVRDCFTFRNKVSAHTAYGSPRDEDNLAMEFHSLVALLSTSYDATGNADTFALGSVSVRLSGEDPSTKLPCISLKELQPKIKDHIEKWTNMLLAPLILVKHKLPIKIGDTEYKNA